MAVCGDTTVTTITSLLVQVVVVFVNVYVSENVPVPLGVNTPPEVTFVPLHVPPVGLNPVNVNGMGWSHKVMSAPAFTTGSGYTVAVERAVELHPAALVTVTV